MQGRTRKLEVKCKVRKEKNSERDGEKQRKREGREKDTERQ